MAGYLPGSGSLAMSTINSVFDGRGNNLNAYRGTTWYTAAGGSGTFSSGAISFNDFYNKGPSPAVTISLASLNGAYLVGSPSFSGEAYSVDLYFNTNGTWNFYGFAAAGSSGNWASPTTTGIGSSYWIRVTRTFFSGGLFNSATGSTGWLQLSSAQIITVTTGGYDGSGADYTVQIATDSGGSNIVATASLSMFASTIPA